MSELKREIKFIPTRFNTLDCKFYLKGEKGIIQFCIRTGCEVDEDMASKPYAFDVGYHSPIPLHEDQKPMASCEFYDPCYYDGSSMYARDVFRMLINHGEERVWNELEKAYYNWLDKNRRDEKVEE